MCVNTYLLCCRLPNHPTGCNGITWPKIVLNCSPAEQQVKIQIWPTGLWFAIQGTGSCLSFYPFPLVIFLYAKVFIELYQIVPRSYNSSLCSKEGKAVYWLSQFYGCCRSQGPSNVLFYLWHSRLLHAPNCFKNKHGLPEGLSEGCGHLKWIKESTKFTRICLWVKLVSCRKTGISDCILSFR